MDTKHTAKLHIYVRAAGGGQRGILQAGSLRLPCALGAGGISAFKREGDCATPRAALRIAGGFCKNSPRPLPRCGLKLRRTTAQDGWCDTPQDNNYNRRIRLPYRAGAEGLSRADALYDIAFVLDWNMRPRVRGRGSAVFFHIARSAKEAAVEASARKTPPRKSCATAQFHPTAGCVAISAQNMRRLMPYLTKGTKFTIL